MSQSADSAIHPETRIGAVSLTVRDLERAVAFYERCLGFTPERDGDKRVHLGAADRRLLTLKHNPTARAGTRSAGLYHFAVLVPSRGALAVALRQLAETRTPLAGASDHGVSEALYLSDPEGNGIEIYRDRPRDEWPWRDGRLAMGTRRLALESLIAEAETGVTGDLPEGTVIGHVHLRVADVAAAEVFYGDVLGFSLMQRYGDSASFVSAGGYHHHIAFNTWESLGASPAAPDSAGLDHFELLLPDETARAQVVERLAKRGSAIGATPLGPSIRDPSGNALVLRLADS